MSTAAVVAWTGKGTLTNEAYQGACVTSAAPGGKKATQRDQAGQAARPRDHPLRRRLRRRDAADRRPLHPGDRVLRQRPLHPPELPGGDPRPAGHAPGRLVVPGPLRGPRHPHAGRLPRRARGDEPGRAQGQPGGHQEGGDDHRRLPRLHRAQPEQGGVRREPARERLPLRVRRARVRAHRHDGGGGQGVRAVPQGRQPREEHVRARPAVLDVRPAHRADHRVPGAALRQGARHPRRQRHRVQGGLELRRDHRGLRRPVRDQAGPDARGHLPQHHRQPGARLRPDRRLDPVRAAAVPGLLPDHPGLRHPPRAEQAQAVRRHHLPGRGRDRRHRRRPRCRVRGRPGRDHHVRPGHRAEVRDDRPRRDDGAAAARGRRAARRARPPGCPPRPSRPTCCRRCSAATARRRCRSWRPSRRPTASTRRSRPPGSRSPTAPR